MPLSGEGGAGSSYPRREVIPIDTDSRLHGLEARVTALESLLAEKLEELRSANDSAIRAAAFELRDHERRLHD